MKLLENILFYKNIRVIDTNHYIEQFIKRNDFISTDDIDKILKRAINKLSGYANHNSAYLIYSKEFNQGIILKYKKGNKHNIIDLITFLPNGKSFAKKNTEKLVVEHEEQIICQDQETMNYIKSSLSSVVENTNEEITKVYLGTLNVGLYFSDNKLYSISGVEIIEIK